MTVTENEIPESVKISELCEVAHAAMNRARISYWEIFVDIFVDKVPPATCESVIHELSYSEVRWKRYLRMSQWIETSFYWGMSDHEKNYWGTIAADFLEIESRLDIQANTALYCTNAQICDMVKSAIDKQRSNEATQ